jgi:hypothetical protein
LIHKLVLVAVLCLGVTTLAFARPHARRYHRPVSIRGIHLSSPSRISYRPDISRACGGQGSCTVYKIGIDRSRFSRYYRGR